MFFVFPNIEVYMSEDIKTLHLLQIASDLFQTYAEFSSQGVWWK